MQCAFLVHGGWCMFVYICTCTYVDHSGQLTTTSPPHTHKICTQLLHHALLCSFNFGNSEHVMIQLIKSTDIDGIFPSVCLQCSYTLDSPTLPVSPTSPVTPQQPMSLPPEQPTVLWSLVFSSISKVHSTRWPY